jgi:hypothetical protein
MAIVINEIEVNVEVTNGSATNASSTSTPGGSKEDIIRECIEKVMEIINQKNER